MGSEPYHGRGYGKRGTGGANSRATNEEEAMWNEIIGGKGKVWHHQNEQGGNDFKQDKLRKKISCLLGESIEKPAKQS